MSTESRRIPHDWHDGVVPLNVHLAELTIVETSYSFHLCRSECEDAIRVGRGSSLYSGTMFDMGKRARVNIGEAVMLNSPRIICCRTSMTTSPPSSHAFNTVYVTPAGASRPTCWARCAFTA